MRLILPLLFGLLGTAVLIGLGVWQLQRLEWKEGVLARIESRIGAEPVPLPEAPDPMADEFLPVRLEGRPDGLHVRVLGAWRGGTGYRVVVPFQMEGRRIMVDLGIVPFEDADQMVPQDPVAIIGNLAWPEEANPSTPIPSAYEYYARDVPDMARFLNTEPILVVARSVDPPLTPRPAPVGTDGIPNNHLGYAIQWFGLAIVWLGMTAFLLWRMTRRTA